MPDAVNDRYRYQVANSVAGIPAQLTVAVVRGEGIGSEVVDAALRVMRAACERFNVTVDIDELPALAVRDDYGLVIDDQSRRHYQDWFARGIPVLHGPAGGRFVYQLRREFGLPVKVTPIIPNPSIVDAALVHPRQLENVDLVIVRDNSAGLYQGAFGTTDDGEAFHEARYRRDQVDVVMDAAIRLAHSRNGRLTVVTKPGGVPSISSMWRESAESAVEGESAAGGTNVELTFLEIDNACFQLVANPSQFDVIVSPNMFGDVLGDTASVLLGSRGMAYSANFGAPGTSVYQTAHGAAHDLAGRNVANPIAQILSLAWLVRDDLGLANVADAMSEGIDAVLAAGVRTADIASRESTVVGTSEMADRIAERVSAGPLS
jgi:3-isopropylmalate dehydrogenase